MSTPVNIKDLESNNTAKVTKFGQLVIGGLDYNTPFSVILDVIDTPFLLVEPLFKSTIILDYFIFVGSKSVNINDANVVLYYSEDKNNLSGVSVLEVPVQRNGTIILSKANLLIPEGNFLLAKTDSVNVSCAIGYYRTPVNI